MTGGWCASVTHTGLGARPVHRAARTARPGSRIRRPAPATGARARPAPGWHLATALRRAWSRHGFLRYAQIIPVGLVLWGLDALDKFRAGAAAAGLAHAPVVAAISDQLGGGFAEPLNDWLAAHPVIGTAAAWYYIVAHGAAVGIVGLLLIWRHAPAFGLHRNALIACNAIGLAAFWLYPVAPPRMLPAYHDTAASAVPVFSSVMENNAAAEFASLPSLHVVWALWAAVAATALLRRPALRAAVWLYPAVTVADVLATANHYLLDVITAPAVLLLAYAIAASPALARRLSLLPVRHPPAGPPPPSRAAHPGAERAMSGPGPVGE
ncbi:MAG TPA: phosphatase PAP2 family protein [Streptosporangiaceae bacterium]